MLTIYPPVWLTQTVPSLSPHLRIDDDVQERHRGAGGHALMPDGKRCPDCGGKIGVWAAKLAWLRGGKVGCPHCHSKLAYDMKAADSIVTLIAFAAIWIATGIVRTLEISWGIDEVWIEVVFFLLALLAVALWSAVHLRNHRPLRRREVEPTGGRRGRWPR